MYATVGSFDGGFRWDGVIFDVEAAGQGLTINSLDFHTWLDVAYRVQVFTRLDDSDDWTKLCDASVQGSGYGKPTQIPPEDFKSVQVGAREHRTFYITLDTPELVIKPGGQNGDTLFRNGDLTVSQGSAVSFGSRRSFPGYQWNGKLRYQLKSTVNVSKPKCEDKSGEIFIDEYTCERSCSWLSSNLSRFEHVCKYVGVSTHCPKTCGVCYIVAP